jgi:two-component system cell cycle response regulator DivK
MASVLVIEDNPVDLDLLRYLLEAGGHRVIQARGGRDGITVAAAEHPDLILCDLRMPMMSGFDVLARLRQLDDLKGTPVIAVTILSDARDRRTALDAGFTGHMPKPIEPAGFLEEIAHYLSGKDRVTQH